MRLSAVQSLKSVGFDLTTTCNELSQLDWFQWFNQDNLTHDHPKFEEPEDVLDHMQHEHEWNYVLPYELTYIGDALYFVRMFKSDQNKKERNKIVIYLFTFNMFLGGIALLSFFSSYSLLFKQTIRYDRNIYIYIYIYL